jgi:hypothetical protein
VIVVASCLRMICNKASLESGVRVRVGGGGGGRGGSESSQHCLDVLQGREEEKRREEIRGEKEGREERRIVERVEMTRGKKREGKGKRREERRKRKRISRGDLAGRPLKLRGETERNNKEERSAG